MHPKSIHSDEYKEIILKIIKSRNEAGLSQKDVARIINKTQSYISKIENCQLRIDVVQLGELAKLFNKNISYFLK